MDPYFLRTIEYSYKDRDFKFDIAQTLFSSYELDTGSKLLIRTIKPSNNPKSLLDLGCGYGVLGIVVSKIFNIQEVVMSDINMLSLRYTATNLKQNNLNAHLIAGVGIENVTKRDFDLIVSNIPAKIGDTAIKEDFILEPLKHLSDNGEYWFVVVSGLNRLIPKIGEEHNLNLKQITKRNRYSVYKLTK